MDVLYLTYDGLTDFIGQSQVLPYLTGCARAGHGLTVISFEKADRFDALGDGVRELCRAAGISWLPQRFRSFPPYISKSIDLATMRAAAIHAASSKRFDLVHGRSYPATLVGMAVKRRFGVPLLFDMRGFWADQRREGGRWRDGNLIGRSLYRRWKSHEANMIARADHIIVLTEAAKRELSSWSALGPSPVSVIPCCTDFDHFDLADAAARSEARRRLDIAPDAPVLAYLGSFGTVYMVASHLNLFAAIKQRDPRAKALFIGRDSKSSILSIAGQAGIDLAGDDLRAMQSERAEVPFWLAAADVGTCFILPTYSSIGVSPTKLAEYLACGIPVIANRSVGDVEAIVRTLGTGHVMADLDDGSIDAAADAFYSLQSVDRDRLRARARTMLDLPKAVAAYRSIYNDPHKSVEVIEP